MCVSGLSYAACKAHGPCHLRPIWLCHSFLHYLINGMIFGTKLLNIKCVLIFSTTFVWKISHSKKNSARYHKCTRSSRDVPVILARFEWILNFLDRFSKNTQISIFVTILSVGAHCSIRTDGRTYVRTDFKKLILVFLNFLNTSKNQRNAFSGYNLPLFHIKYIK